MNYNCNKNKENSKQNNKKTYKTATKLIKEQLDFYYKFAVERENKINKYLNRLVVLNKENPNFVATLNYNLIQDYRNKYIDLVQKTILFKDLAIKEGLTLPIFLTLTTNTQYHKFKLNKKGNKYIKNPNYNKNFSINDAYRVLQNTFNNIIKELAKIRSNRDVIKNYFIKVIEKHKNLTPHMHCLIFINREDYKHFLNVVKNKVNAVNIDFKQQHNKKTKEVYTKIRFNTDSNKNKGDIGRIEVERIKDINQVANYLSKYIRKQFQKDENGDNKHLYELDGWAKSNRIRLVSTSRTPIPKYIYSKVNKFIDEKVKEQYKKENKNLLNYIHENSTIIERIDGVEKTTYKGENTLFKVIVDKKIVKKNIEVGKDFFEFLIKNKNLIETDEIDDKTKYFKILTALELEKFDFFKWYGDIYLDNGELIDIEEDFSFKLNELVYFLKNRKTIELEYKVVENIRIYKNNKLIYNKKDFYLYTKHNTE